MKNNQTVRIVIPTALASAVSAIKPETVCLTMYVIELLTAQTKQKKEPNK